MRKYKGRYCSRFSCSFSKDRRCCADCWRRKKNLCKISCRNDPARCGLMDNRKVEDGS